MRLPLKMIWKFMVILAFISFINVTYIGASSEGGHEGGHAEEGGESHELAQNQQLLEKEIRRHFHNAESGLINPPAPPQGVAESKSFCMYCHGSFPHISNRVVRAMFNFHKIFIACETCHYKERLNK
ncbi:MAG: hypothetical protein HY934_00320, partial [Candidatus Firestonebacteria bacterium]|nr:hypothetical protein [Candidatus Firestonebacteria bacterium]